MIIMSVRMIADTTKKYICYDKEQDGIMRRTTRQDIQSSIFLYLSF